MTLAEIPSATQIEARLWGSERMALSENLGVQHSHDGDDHHVCVRAFAGSVRERRRRKRKAQLRNDKGGLLAWRLSGALIVRTHTRTHTLHTYKRKGGREGWAGSRFVPGSPAQSRHKGPGITIAVFQGQGA